MKSENLIHHLIHVLLSNPNFQSTAVRKKKKKKRFDLAVPIVSEGSVYAGALPNPLYRR